MMTAWGYDPGRISDDRSGKTTSLMQPMRGMDWKADELMQPTRVQDVTSPMRFKNSDLRSKCPNGTVYIWKHMLPLLLVCVIGMPLILLVHVVGIPVMSQNTSTRILGLTEINCSSPRMSNES